MRPIKKHYKAHRSHNTEILENSAQQEVLAGAHVVEGFVVSGDAHRSRAPPLPLSFLVLEC